ncbi:breast cancer type 2 susceptibility protein isoform X1 [Biomphalaria pfeifferi]|uniref:Breast cancer type 2 susceptibility protein isoform X1 n=1 Tax=Biomphalaria pfeifferi TaxID=112525 RepID=A0AAD8ASU0_BIOPF|nr:breast cancer type 2 susceptibility protein isoform X1 [Biomphalaria pfeifferi]
MYPCHCCKSSHRDLPLVSTWGPSDSDDEILDETILSELGETSLDWFDKLTEDYLVQHSNDSHSLLTSSPNVSEGWSPFPKGGFCYLPREKNLSVDVTPLTALFSSPKNSQKDSQLRARIQAISDSIVTRDFPLQTELNWTSSMATPAQKCIGDSENKENLPEGEQLKERKVIHRQLFSPSGSSFCDDSFSLVGDHWSEGDLTVETEKTVISEKEISFGSDKTLCEHNNQEASTDSVDNCDVTSDTNCDNMNECDKRQFSKIPVVSSHDRHMHPTASNTLLMESDDNKFSRKSCPEATLSHNISSDSCETKIHFSDSMNDQCYLGLFQDSSFDSMQERTTDIDVSVISCESGNKSERIKVAINQQNDNSKKNKNSGNTDSSHIEKVLSKVFVSQENVENVTKDPRQNDEYQCNAFNSLEEIIATNLDPDCNLSRKRQTLETVPQAKRQKVETPSKKSKESVCMEDGHLSCETPRRSDEHLCDESFLDENKQDSPEPVKKKNVTISILKNPLTPKSTNKKKVQFNLDNSSAQKSFVGRPAADYVDTSKLQAISTATVSHLIEASTPDLMDPLCLSKSASELAMYFFKDSDSSADYKTCHESPSPCHDVGYGQENHYEPDMKQCKTEFVTDSTMSNKSDTEDHQTISLLNWTKDSKLLLSLKVDTDLLEEYSFDSSFEVSPTFCSQVAQTKTSETIDDPSASAIEKLNAETDSVRDEIDTANHNEKSELSLNLLAVTFKNKAEENHLFVKSQVSSFAGFDSDNVCAAVSNVEKETDMEDPLYETNFKIKCDNTNRSEMLVVASTDFQPISPRTESLTETSLQHTCNSTTSRDSAQQAQSLQLSTSKTSWKPEGKHLSKKPKRFQYPSTDQIASIGPETAVTKDSTFKPTAGLAIYLPKADLNLPTHNTSVCPPNLDTNQLLQSTKNESVINIIKGYENQDQHMMSASSSLGFSTFSEVYSRVNDDTKQAIKLEDCISSNGQYELSHSLDMPAISESIQVVIQPSYTKLDLQTSVIVNESLTSPNMDSSPSNKPHHDLRLSTDATDSAKSQSCLVKSTQMCHTAVVLDSFVQNPHSESYSVSPGCQTPELATTIAQSFTSDVLYSPTLNTYSSNISQQLLLTREDAETVTGKSCIETDLTFTNHPEISHEKDSYCDEETMTSQIWTATEFTQILDSSNLQEITHDNNTSGQSHSDLTTLHPAGKDISHDIESYEHKKIDMLDSSCHSDRLAPVMQTETRSPCNVPHKSTSYANDGEIKSRLISDVPHKSTSYANDGEIKSRLISDVPHKSTSYANDGEIKSKFISDVPHKSTSYANDGEIKSKFISGVPHKSTSYANDGEIKSKLISGVPHKSTSYANDGEIKSRLISDVTELMKESKSDADTTEACSVKLKDVIKECECKDYQICKGFTIASGQLFSNLDTSNSKSISIDKHDCFLSSRNRKINCQKQLPCACSKVEVDQQSVMVVPPGSGVCRDSSFTIPSITTAALCGSEDNSFFDQSICNNESYNRTESKQLTVLNKEQGVDTKSISNGLCGYVTTNHSSPGQLTCSVKTDAMSIDSLCSASSFKIHCLSDTMAGFSTAGGKQIKLSESAKTKAKNLWDSISMDSDHHGPLTSDLHGPLTSGQEKDFLHESNSTYFKCAGLTETKTSNDSSIDLKPKGFRPFKPPAIKRKSESSTKSQIEISRNVTELHKQKIDEWDDDSCLRDVIINERNIPTVPSSCTTYPDKQKHACLAPEVSDLYQVSKIAVTTAGFTTASGKTMSVSDQGLLSAKKLWQDLDLDVFEMTSEPDVKHIDFSFSVTDSDHTVHETPENHNKLCPMVKAPVTKRGNKAVNNDLSQKQSFLSSSTVEVKEAIQKKSLRNIDDNTHKHSHDDNTHKHSPSTKKEWSPNEEINLVSDFSFESCATVMSYCDSVSASSSDSTKHNAVSLSHIAGNCDSALLKPLVECQDLVSKTVSNSAQSEHPGYNSLKQKHLPETNNKYNIQSCKADSDVSLLLNRTLNHNNICTAMSTTLLSVTNTISELDLLVTTMPGLQELTHSTASHMKQSWSEKPKLHSAGFSTASGSKVTVSEEAMRQAQTSLEYNASSSFRDVPTDNEQDKITKPNNGTACDFTLVNKKVSRFPGFSTASGTSVYVSDKALLHAKTFLEESDEAVDMYNVIKVFDHAHSLLNDTSKDAVVSTTPKNDLGTIFAGFSTASGAKVSVSKKALDHAHSLLNDTSKDAVASTTPKNDVGTISAGFSTASGAKVSVSKKALDHAHSLLNDTSKDAVASTTPKNDVGTISAGFSTASGAKVSVSKKALDHAHSLLNDTSKDAVASTTPKNDVGTISAGFSTASGAKVSVSKKALDHAHSLLNDTSKDSVSNTTLMTDAASISDGFSPASGTKVSVSKKALVHVQNTLEDTYNELDLSTDIAHKSTVSPFFVSVGSSKPSSKDQVDVLKGDLKTVTDSKTPVTDRLKAIVKASSVKEDVPNNFSLTPVSATYEEFHYDRPVTRSGKRLYPVKPRSLTNEFCPSPAIQSTKPSSCFKPPSKKVKLSCENDQQVPSPTLSMGQKCETVRSSFVSPAFTCPSVAASPKIASTPELATASVPSLTGDGHQCVKKTAHAPEVKDSVDLEDDLENLLLCQDFQSLPPTASAKFPKDTSHSLSNESCTLMTCASEKHVPDISELKSKNKMYIISEDVLEEERMKQEKIICYKKRTQVLPLCGRWVKLRQQKGTLQKLSDLEPSVGLTREQLMSLGVSASTLDINSLTAREFRFDLRRFHPALNAAVLIGDGALLVPDRCGYAGVEEFVRAFLTLDSVDASLVDDNWIGNHYRWIVWKLAAYEVNFSQHLAGRSLTPDNVMLQLKYRYDREVDACERSALKKILERDDTASKRMVLCVASIICTSDGQYCVELSDGWYSVRGQLDQRLTDLISRKKIITGDKIITSGAELVGGQEACSPLEVKEDIALKIHGNSTRPAPWHARLGFCCPPSPLCVSIKSLCPDGGHLGAVDVVLARIYPVMYMEKLKDGGCVFHTAEEEDKLRQKHEAQREAEMEKMYSSLEKERKVKCKGKKQNLKKLSRKEIEALWDGQEIAHALENALNSEEIQQLLSSSQTNRLMEYRQRETDRHQEEIKKRLMEAMTQTTVRNVTPVLKLKVNGVSAVDIDDSVSCLVTVWRPGVEWTSMEEGRRYKLYNMAVSGVRCRSGAGKISLTATRQSRLQLCSINDNLLDMVYEPRQAWIVSELTTTVPMGNEFDFVGVVIQLIPSSRLSQPTLLYAADKNGEFLCIKIWSSSQTSSLKSSQVFVAYNLVLSTSSHNSTGQSLLTADTRSDLTTMTTNGHSSRYSEGFSQMQMLCKCPDFVIGLKSELEHCLSSHQPKTVSKTLPDVHFSHAEDFPVDIVDKIFSPMSRAGGWSSNSKLTSTASKSVCVSINNSEKQRGYTSSNSFKASSDATNSLQSSSLDQRKQLLRDKMAKLLAYDQPAPLERLPLGGSPACKKKFKSPSTKKTS